MPPAIAAIQAIGVAIAATVSASFGAYVAMSAVASFVIGATAIFAATKLISSL